VGLLELLDVAYGIIIVVRVGADVRLLLKAKQPAPTVAWSDLEGPTLEIPRADLLAYLQRGFTYWFSKSKAAWVTSN